MWIFFGVPVLVVYYSGFDVLVKELHIQKMWRIGCRRSSSSLASRVLSFPFLQYRPFVRSSLLFVGSVLGVPQFFSPMPLPFALLGCSFVVLVSASSFASLAGP